ncbi:unnamed protein product [Rhizophagus irregularis]|nr:unnamed protein product [Rhizophagus irregularis]
MAEIIVIPALKECVFWTTSGPDLYIYISGSYPYSHSPSNTFIHPTSIHPISSPTTNHELPSVTEFFLNLDQKYNCNNIYSKFENAFLEEEITVNAIKDLTDEQMVKLGIVKIGWQKNIRQAAQRY